jgi:hypothetical protein
MERAGDGLPESDDAAALGPEAFASAIGHRRWRAVCARCSRPGVSDRREPRGAEKKREPKRVHRLSVPAAPRATGTLFQIPYFCARLTFNEPGGVGASPALSAAVAVTTGGLPLTATALARPSTRSEHDARETIPNLLPAGLPAGRAKPPANSILPGRGRGTKRREALTQSRAHGVRQRRYRSTCRCLGWKGGRPER